MRLQSTWYKLAVCVFIATMASSANAQAPRYGGNRPVPPLLPDQAHQPRERDVPRELRIEPPTDDVVKPVVQPGLTRRKPIADSLPATPLPERPKEPTKLLSSSPTPLVTVEVIGPATAIIGHSIPYEILVRNLGSVSVQKIAVEQELPRDLQYMSGEPAPERRERRLNWKFDELEAGAERRMKVTVMPQADGDFRTSASVSFTVSSGCTTRVTKPNLSVKMTGPETALIGDEVAFQIEVANSGTTRLERVVLRDRLPAGLHHPQGREIEADIGALEPGEVRAIVLRTKATGSGTQANTIRAVAEIDGAIQQTGGPKPPAVELTATATVHVGEPNLRVKQAGPKHCQLRTESIFTVEVSNTGTAICRNVRVTDRLPPNLEFVAASDDGHYDPAARTVSWALGALDFGTQRMLTVKTRASRTGECMNSVAARADGDIQAQSDLPIRIESTPALSLEILELDNPAPTRKDVTYEIRVLNQGSAPCTNLQISMTLPEGMILRDAQAPAPYKLQQNQVVFAPYARLATRADLVYRIVVQSRTPGDAKLRVQLTCDQLQRPVVKEEISRFFEP